MCHAVVAATATTAPVYCCTEHTAVHNMHNVHGKHSHTVQCPVRFLAVAIPTCCCTRHGGSFRSRSIVAHWTLLLFCHAHCIGHTHTRIPLRAHNIHTVVINNRRKPTNRSVQQQQHFTQHSPSPQLTVTFTFTRPLHHHLQTLTFTPSPHLFHHGALGRQISPICTGEMRLSQ